jgi:YD repeat-containing protein
METNALGKTRYFEYEGHLPVKKTDRNGRVIEFEYNDFDKPVAEKWFDTDGKQIETIAYQFDSLGKLESVKDSSGIQTLEYDELDHNTQTVFEFAGLKTPVALQNAFDENNRRVKSFVKLSDNVDSVTRYSYDANNHITEISQNEKRVEYSYN